MTTEKIKYYDASLNPDHFTKEQIERVGKPEVVLTSKRRTPAEQAEYMIKIGSKAYDRYFARRAR